jgi:hypothetical protein
MVTTLPKAAFSGMPRVPASTAAVCGLTTESQAAVPMDAAGLAERAADLSSTIQNRLKRPHASILIGRKAKLTRRSHSAVHQKISLRAIKCVVTAGAPRNRGNELDAHAKHSGASRQRHDKNLVIKRHRKWQGIWREDQHRTGIGWGRHRIPTRVAGTACAGRGAAAGGRRPA